MTEQTNSTISIGDISTNIRTLLLWDEHKNLWVKMFITMPGSEYCMLINPNNLKEMAQGFYDLLTQAYDEALRETSKSDIIVAPADTLHALKEQK